ncbi:MAG: PCRF domain-containing protein, partial [Patescibacteria group bacterium]
MRDFLADIETEYQNVTRALEDPEVVNDPKKLAELGRKKTELDTIMNRVARFRFLERSMQENAEILNDATADEELKGLALE